MDIQQPPFKFCLGNWVQILTSRAIGQVRARRDGIGFPNQYLVAYQDLHGTPLQAWWCEDQLAASSKPMSRADRVCLSREHAVLGRGSPHKSQPVAALASSS